MPKNKNALLRYLTLDKCFRNNHRFYYIDDLQQACEEALVESGSGSGISIRQIQNDIMEMKKSEVYNAPICSYSDGPRPGRQTYYRYSDPSFSINNQIFSPDELEKLVQTIQMLGSVVQTPSFDWFHELIPILEKRIGKRVNRQPAISQTENIDLKGSEYFGQLFNCIITKQCATIVYENFKGEIISTNFHPKFLKQYNERWYLFGKADELEYSIANFALDRIEKISSSNAPYIDFEINWNDYFSDFIGVTKLSDKEEKIRFCVSDSTLKYIETKPLHQTQRSIKIDGKPNALQISVIPNYELESQILSFGENIEIVEPKWLKEKIRTRLTQSLKKYSTP